MGHAERLAQKHHGGSTRRRYPLPLFAALALLNGAQLPASSQGVDAAIEQALLKEDWPAILTLPQLANDAALASGARFIKGHAYLATNRNNESLCLFLGATDAELTQWDAWTRRFIEQRPSIAIAHYLRGDALARLKQWDAALAEFDTALNIRSDFALALNARGVARTGKAAWHEALLDFDEATRANPRLADGYANRGATYVQLRDGAAGAAKAFETALQHSPGFVLALNGLGAVRIVLDDWDDAQRALMSADKGARGCLAPILDTVHLNALALTMTESEALSDFQGRLAAANPGMEMNTVIRNLTPAQAARYMGALNNAIAHNNYWASSPAMPSRITNQSTRTVEVGLVGNLPFARANLTNSTTTTFNPLQVTRQNAVSQQSNFAQIARAHPNVTAERMSGFRAWVINQSDPVGRQLSHGRAGGVSTEAIGSARVDAGDWKITTLYGLVYPIQSSETSK